MSVWVPRTHRGWIWQHLSNLIAVQRGEWVKTGVGLRGQPMRVRPFQEVR